MPSFVEATVTEILSERKGLQRVLVHRSPSATAERAYVLTFVIGPVRTQDRVVVNTTAVDLGLGTGGWHVVHWNLSRNEWVRPGSGHVLKLRYTSMQVDTGVAEEFESHPSVPDLEGTPVVACLLHSQVAAVAVAAKHLRPDIRIAYVMTDQASLPLALSDLLHDLTERRLVDVTISAGQAFGGDHEAVNTASALQIAKGLGADLIIVAEGPGVVGTGTALGFSGLEMVAALDDIRRAGGRPLLALRWSDADHRERHRGMSHHSRTVLDRTATAVTIGVPVSHSPPILPRHLVRSVEIPDVDAMFSTTDLTVTSMGRSPSEDPGFFAFASAAGIAAVELLEPPQGRAT